MTRRTISTALIGLSLSLIVSLSAHAGDIFFHGGNSRPGGPGIRANSTHMNASAPVTNAGMYPMPVQHVPPHLGGAYITNPAFYPHEFLYAHQHHYLAPPFYYIPHSGPFGFLHKGKSRDCCEDPCPRCGSCGCDGKCKLRGTEIIVKYKTKKPWYKRHFLSPR